MQVGLALAVDVARHPHHLRLQALVRVDGVQPDVRGRLARGAALLDGVLERRELLVRELHQKGGEVVVFGARVTATAAGLAPPGPCQPLVQRLHQPHLPVKVVHPQFGAGRQRRAQRLGRRQEPAPGPKQVGVRRVGGHRAVRDGRRQPGVAVGDARNHRRLGQRRHLGRRRLAHPERRVELQRERVGWEPFEGVDGATPLVNLLLRVAHKDLGGLRVRQQDVEHNGVKVLGLVDKDPGVLGVQNVAHPVLLVRALAEAVEREERASDRVLPQLGQHRLVGKELSWVRGRGVLAKLGKLVDEALLHCVRLALEPRVGLRQRRGCERADEVERAALGLEAHLRRPLDERVERQRRQDAREPLRVELAPELLDELLVEGHVQDALTAERVVRLALRLEPRGELEERRRLAAAGHRLDGERPLERVAVDVPAVDAVEPPHRRLTASVHDGDPRQLAVGARRLGGQLDRAPGTRLKWHLVPLEERARHHRVDDPVELETHHRLPRVDAHALGAGVGGGADVQRRRVGDQRVVRAVDADEGEAFDAEDGETRGGHRHSVGPRVYLC